MRLIRSFLLLIAVMAQGAGASAGEGPEVVVSIKPLHSLVAAVMEGVDDPYLIVKGANSPHGYRLRPSDANALAQSEVIFWVGENFERFLKKPIESIGTSAKIVSLEETPNLIVFKFREGGPFESQDQDHNGGEEPAGLGDHAAGVGTDMHFWLDPLNAQAMVRLIEDTLVAADPKNSAAYKANAAALQEKLVALTAELESLLEAVKDQPYVVFHDGYQYFEKRFGLNAVGAVTVSPETIPGAARVSEIRRRVKELGAVCVFAEPQFQPKLIAVIIEGSQARAGILDPLGATLDAGPGAYSQLMRDMVASFKRCFLQGN
jgi:zinc transport system substrate-binding protein